MNASEHEHCPDGCDHPQPILVHKCNWSMLSAGAKIGKQYCGRCWVRFGELVETVPCAPGGNC